VNKSSSSLCNLIVKLDIFLSDLLFNIDKVDTGDKTVDLNTILNMQCDI
jgi:hypothetical protein